MSWGQQRCPEYTMDTYAPEVDPHTGCFLCPPPEGKQEAQDPEDIRGGLQDGGLGDRASR